jgi:hypothetical protein
MAISSQAGNFSRMIKIPFIALSALPPNVALQLTSKSVTPFAKRRAKGAPLFLAAEL